MKFSAADRRKLFAMAGVPDEPIRAIDGLFMFGPAGTKALSITLPAPGPDPVKRFLIQLDRYQPTTLNRLVNSHHMEAARLKKIDTETILGACLEQGVTRATTKRRVTLVIVLGKGQRGPDKDCWWKSTLDALVNAGALVNDSPRWVETAGEPQYLRAEMKATRIILEDMT